MSNPFKIVELQQRSREWHEWRKNGIGASDANVVMSRGHGANNLLNIKIGLAEENSFQSEAMKRGAELEDEARGAYIAKISLEVNPACVE